MLFFSLGHEFSWTGLIGKYFPDGIPTVWWLLSIFVYFGAAYLLGSLNSAVIVSKVMFKDDIRKYGSGNAGFTNMMRTFGTKAAAITFVGDIMKTVVAVLLAWGLRGYISAFVAGLACFLGHLFPCFYQFKGGKGVLCAAAMMLVLDIRIFAFLILFFLIGALVTKYISFGSILAAMIFPLVTERLNVTGYSIIVVISFIIAAIVVFKHRSNLKRIFNGTESKFSFKKSKEKAEETKNG